MSPEGEQRSRAHTRPLWVAGLIAAVSAPIAFWAVLAGIELAIRGGSLGEEIMRALGMMAMFGIPLSLAVTFIVGYPIALWLRKVGRLSAPNLCAGALVIGVIMAVVLSRLAFQTIPVHVGTVAVGGAVALFAGIVFCLAAGISFRRPSA